MKVITRIQAENSFSSVGDADRCSENRNLFLMNFGIFSNENFWRVQTFSLVKRKVFFFFKYFIRGKRKKNKTKQRGNEV